MVGMRMSACAALVALSAAASAQPCGVELRGTRVESAQYIIVYRSQPAIAVGRHFALDIVACAKAGAAEPALIAVDAFMPDHGHGMNYKPVVKKSGASSRFHAEGLMFHMPGRWELNFDVQSAGRTERLTRSILLK